MAKPPNLGTIITLAKKIVKVVSKQTPNVITPNVSPKHLPRLTNEQIYGIILSLTLY